MSIASNLTLEVKTQFILDAAIAQARDNSKILTERSFLLKCYFERIMLQVKLLIIIDHDIRRLSIMKIYLIYPLNFVLYFMTKKPLLDIIISQFFSI